jgi:hypothetical protein
LVCVSWHLSPYKRLLHRSLPSVCVSVCVSLLSLLDKGTVKCIPPFVVSNFSVNTFPRQRIHPTIKELFDASFCMRSASYQRSFFSVKNKCKCKKA